MPMLRGRVDPFDMLPDLRYDRMFEAIGCHGEHVAEPDEIRPGARARVRLGQGVGGERDRRSARRPRAARRQPARLDQGVSGHAGSADPHERSSVCAQLARRAGDRRPRRPASRSATTTSASPNDTRGAGRAPRAARRVGRRSRPRPRRVERAAKAAPEDAHEERPAGEPVEQRLDRRRDVVDERRPGRRSGRVRSIGIALPSAARRSADAACASCSTLEERARIVDRRRRARSGSRRAGSARAFGGRRAATRAGLRAT